MGSLIRYPDHKSFEDWRAWAESITDTLTKHLGSLPDIPVGHVILYQGKLPTGYLQANGATFSSLNYPGLKAILGGTTLPNIAPLGVFKYAVKAG